ncbi:DUF3710 domain-containing protein [Rothia sp. CCM 9417]|uniref:DUF3710 domain-containing protein n=1 Tax=unclassified Rothia (in: high G+C Gram-positive bacteria) TaxID=2689056 RepID=UPI003AD07795
MFGFGKKKQEEVARADAEKVEEPENPSPEQEAALDESADKATGPTSDDTPVVFSREDGPWDISEKSTGHQYIDLGGLFIKSNPGLNLRLEADTKSQQVIAVTLQMGEGSLQVQAFAAPKSRGIWEDIRHELSESVRQQGGQVEFSDGAFGRQLITRVPAELPDGRKGFRIARFVGIDGPRWFVRGVFSGKAVLPGQDASALEEVLRNIVVNRGSKPMAPRDLLPMRVPQNIQEAAAQQQAAAHEGDSSKPSLEVPRRGPEITEIG